MAKNKEYEAMTEELVLPMIEENKFELVDVEYVKEGGNWYLRVYIDKPGGINIDDCELISRALSDKLDEKDFIEDAYILEVSSPGLGRPLKKDKDFTRNMGEMVEIKLFRQINKQKEYEGILKAFDKETVTIEADDGEDIVFERSDIALIRLALDF
ncbi:ribosome maturation factor RimP [Lachnospiraceae bacterium HCP1S3_C3]|nr:ribosome maturation factor RimP [Lachnospiraceae bacterium]MDD6858343.1 ribosome maturation factor RimP [Lachnospiraceae bacterium]